MQAFLWQQFPVLNGTRTLSPDTRTRILQAAAELNYIPNAQARNLKSCSSREICVIFPDLESLCYNEFLKGMLMQAEKLNYALTVCCSYNNIRTEQTLIENAISKKCAGLLLVTCQPQNTAFFQDILAHHSIEIVFLDRLPSRMDALYFGFDNYTAVHFLTSQLIQNGYKDIALLSGHVRFSSLIQKPPPDTRKLWTKPAFLSVQTANCQQIPQRKGHFLSFCSPGQTIRPRQSSQLPRFSARVPLKPAIWPIFPFQKISVF